MDAVTFNSSRSQQRQSGESKLSRQGGPYGKDLIGRVRVGGSGRALCEQRQQASRDKALPCWALARACPRQAVGRQNRHRNSEDGDGGPVLGDKTGGTATACQDHNQSGVHLYMHPAD